MDYDSLAEAGSMVGSGGLIIMDRDTCMVDIARFYLDFTQDDPAGNARPAGSWYKAHAGNIEPDYCRPWRNERPGAVGATRFCLKNGSLCGRAVPLQTRFSVRCIILGRVPGSYSTAVLPGGMLRS